MKLINKKTINYKGKVFDLTVENSHSYNVEDISVHNSAAGSLLSWCLDITKIDPVRFDLYFERFLNPERKCLTEDNFVLMADGSYKLIIDIKENDIVQTKNGVSTVLEIVERPLEDKDFLLEIETEEGAIIRLTNNHIVPVIREDKIIQIKAEEILYTDYLFTF